MTDAATEPVDFWSILEEAERTVAAWPAWRQRYDVDVYGPAATPRDARAHAVRPDPAR